MQLKRKVAGPLAAAACALLGSAQGNHVRADESNSAPDPWKLDVGFLYYAETDRVSDASVSVLARKVLREENELTLKLTVDTLSGASGSGALPANVAQTFTNPSGEGSYTTAPGETPLDSTFLDTRFAVAANWERLLGRHDRVNLGLSFSTEYDYLHAGINGRYSRDFNQNNTTLSAGFAFASDSIDPVGGSPIALSPMLGVNRQSNKLGSESKTVSDLVLGWSQIVSRKLVTQLNYSLSSSSGYLTDPYKIVSVVAPTRGDPVAGPDGLFLYRFESRPDARTKHSLFGQAKYHLKDSILDTSYRYMTDDWGIDSHTLELHYRIGTGVRFIEPQLRFYTQTGADFFTPSLIQGESLPNHATADYRLGDLDTVTVGLKYGFPVGQGRRMSVRAAYYKQMNGGSAGAFGVQQDLDLFPDVDALIVQLGYGFSW